VAGAVHAPWHAFTAGPRDGRLLPAAEVARRLGALGVGADRPVIVYGRWDQGWGEEGRLFWMLDHLGHPEVRVLFGGWAGWRGAVRSGASAPPAPGAFTARPVAERRWTTARLAARAEAVQVLDVRSPAEFAGATPYGSVRGGHVPGARSLFWKGAFEADGRLKDRAALRAWFVGAGVRFDQPVVAYCTGGVRSGFVYLLLRWLDHPSPGNDDGSWWAWAADGGRPVER
jgi:thiosulfate/3-mercaptopyruvate sulfurtransferase